MTIKDIAKIAGVSKSTVSRYLNNGYVSEENKKKISAAITKTGYRTNVFARGLKTNRSQLIAVVIPRLNSYTSVATLEGMNAVFMKNNYQMVVMPKDKVEEDELTYIRKLTTQGFDAIVVMAHAVTDEHVELAESTTTPILFLGQDHVAIQTMNLDNYAMGQQVAKYVNTLSTKSALYISVSESDHSVGVCRKQGLLENIKIPVRTLISGFNRQDAYEVMKKEAHSIKFDTLIAATDNLAIGAIQYLHEQGYTIPEDIKVIGIGNYDIGELITPSLSTLAVDYQRFGENSALTVLDMIDPTEETILLKEPEYHVIERNSTK